MIIVTWNVRGPRGPERRRWVRHLIEQEKIDIIMLQETKLESISNSALRKIGAGRLRKWVSKKAQGLAGGFLIGWNSALVEDIESCVGNFGVAVLFRRRDTGFTWATVNIYGPHASDLRR